ncbi:hypothetical protein B0O80DRAFT_413107 [Mortierella sp. GBAus27b]|nr:hypothetical protein BGX31_004519 [Mortierella sp. GBA43]KAI8357079.1 hypothetical protein B0O80DRAFT_413107 [Mortierella sp. GBAus27b]
MSLTQAQRTEAENLLPGLLEQEKELQFSRFTNEDAFVLGSSIRAAALAMNKGITIQITRNGQTIFLHSMEGTTLDNENWARRKTNTVIRLQHSSYYIGRRLAVKGETDMEKTYRVSNDDYACHGGGFPLLIKGVGCVGAIVVSGLKQDEDHALVVASIRTMIASMEK